MKEPDIKEMKKKLCIPDEDEFLGYLIFNTDKEDFLLSYSDVNNYCSFKKWVALPDLALKFDSYIKVRQVINNLEINETTIVVMAFDLDSHIGIIPFEFLLAN